MAFNDLKTRLETRLDEADRGDRGWWLLTRVHVSAERLRDIAEYIYSVAGPNDLSLTSGHYTALAALLGVSGQTPSVTINRHYFLAMDSPLRLLERVNGAQWADIRLTSAGCRLATDPNTPGVFEQALESISFCKEPWYSQAREAAFADFDIRPHDAAKQVLAATSGWIDIDEFDLFVSRIRVEAEIPGAIQGIQEFRTLGQAQRDELLHLVEQRIPVGPNNSNKRYSNWRDMARHTFSLLALGTTFTRQGNLLVLSAGLVTAAKPKPSEAKPSEAKPASPSPQSVPKAAVQPILKLPTAPQATELDVPPAAPVTNSGNDAELYVGKLLSAAGWQVVYYGNRKGFGFDIWAKKDAQNFVIEVKSSLAKVSQVNLTPMEYASAKHHGANYLLVLVDNVGKDDVAVSVVQDPAATLEIKSTNVEQHQIAGANWRAVAKALELEG